MANCSSEDERSDEVRDPAELSELLGWEARLQATIDAAGKV